MQDAASEKTMRKTILLADDSPTIRRLVTQTFADADFKIVEVSNGDAAIKAMEEVKPNLVLADIYMPGKNGYEVCTFVRNHPSLSVIPVILLVGAFDAFNDETAKQAGATANIKKPFEPGALIELVTSVLSGDAGALIEPEPVQETRPKPQPKPQRELKPEPTRVSKSASSAAPASLPVAAAAPAPEDDLLGLKAIFVQDPAPTANGISEADVDRIADRVIQKLSTQVIESIAWEIVPDITEKIVRQELKRINES
jgi:CheY-like chemotaxis protein